MKQLIAPDSGAIDNTAGRLFVLPNANGSIDIFSTSDGSFLASPSLSAYGKLGYLGNLAVDEVTHRLIIGGTGGALVVATEAPHKY